MTPLVQAENLEFRWNSTVEALLHENAALFAGGELSQDEKDAFFEAITQAYFASKSEAKRKFGPKE